MSIKKLCGVFAVVLAFCGFSAAAFGCDPAGVSTNIKLLANNVRCVAVLDDDPDLLWKGAPLWQKRGKKADGCEVHASLTKLLYAPSQGNKGKNGPARGAARAVEDGQYAYAWELLDKYIYDSVMVAKPADDPANPAIWAFAERALSLRDDVDELLTSCP